MSTNGTRELLSALMDGELSELELRRLLADDDLLTPELSAQWARWHVIKDALQGCPQSGQVDMAACASISAAIAGQKPRGMINWRHSLSRVAVAASVAVAVVAGWQTWQTGDVSGASMSQVAGMSASSFSAQPVNDSFRTDLSGMVPIMPTGETQPVAETFTIPTQLYRDADGHLNKVPVTNKDNDASPYLYLATPGEHR